MMSPKRKSGIENARKTLSISEPERDESDERGAVSRPSEKFLIEPSRKFILTAERQKDGTNRDEPRGTGLVRLAETSPGRKYEPTGSCPENGSERPLGAPAYEAHGQARGCGGGAWAAGAAVQSQAFG